VAALNLGTGYSTDPAATNVDRVAHPGVDVIWDLDEHPWPFDDQAFDEVRAVQLFEHLTDPLGFMADAHRVLQPGGLLLIVVPHWQSENSHTDPTHVRHCTERTFDYWCEGEALHAQFGAAYAGPATFTKESVVRSGDDIFARLRRTR
jgi:SAM-dependent methyltransferase